MLQKVLRKENLTQKSTQKSAQKSVQRSAQKENAQRKLDCNFSLKSGEVFYQKFEHYEFKSSEISEPYRTHKENAIYVHVQKGIKETAAS